MRRALLPWHMGNAELDVWMGPEEDPEIARATAKAPPQEGPPLQKAPPLGTAHA